MKKKNLIWMLTFMMVATMCVCFTSCSKDSDDGSKRSGGSASSALVGTWSRSYQTGDGNKAKETWTFNTSSGSYSNAYQTATFTYYAAQGYLYLKIKYNDMSSYVEDVKQYSISGNTLYLDGNQFTKQ